MGSSLNEEWLTGVGMSTLDHIGLAHIIVCIPELWEYLLNTSLNLTGDFWEGGVLFRWNCIILIISSSSQGSRRESFVGVKQVFHAPGILFVRQDQVWAMLGRCSDERSVKITGPRKKGWCHDCSCTPLWYMVAVQTNYGLSLWLCIIVCTF